MCPGGTVVAATSEPGRVVTNGMSQYSRNERNANAGIVVAIAPADYAPPLEEPDREYPFFLTTGRVVYHYLSGNQTRRIGALVENALFATLDAAVRRATTNDGRVYTLVDTVGFVRNLPHQLVEAFRSTLEEVRDCDIIVHVVDASHPDPAGQLETVRAVIGELEARSIPEIVAFNKTDLMTEDERLVLRGLEPKAVFTSAHTGEGIDELLERIAQLLPKPSISSATVTFRSMARNSASLDLKWW